MNKLQTLELCDMLFSLMSIREEIAKLEQPPKYLFRSANSKENEIREFVEQCFDWPEDE